MHVRKGTPILEILKFSPQGGGCVGISRRVLRTTCQCMSKEKIVIELKTCGRSVSCDTEVGCEALSSPLDLLGLWQMESFKFKGNPEERRLLKSKISSKLKIVTIALPQNAHSERKHAIDNVRLTKLYIL